MGKIMKKKKINRWLSGILLCAMLLSNTIFYVSAEASGIYGDLGNSFIQPAKKTGKASGNKVVSWPEGPSAKSLSSKSAIVMDINSGQILYELKSHKEHYPASITKIMTTLLCLENSSLSETVVYSENAVFGIEAGSSNMWIAVDEKLSMEDSLYCIMLESANEACLGVAEHIAGSVDNFVDMMNDRVKELGLKNTHFQNPNGLHNDNHYTSAYDMAVISCEAMKNSTFRKITGTKTYTVMKTNKNDVRYMRNHQQLLYGYDYPQYTYKYCIGGKTGYTSVAGATLVTFAKKDGLELVCVTMAGKSGKQGEPNCFTDSIKLLNYAFENYRQYDIGNEKPQESENPLIFARYNPLFDSTDSPVHLSDNASIVLPKGAKLKDAKKQITYDKNVALQDGPNVIGKISYTYNGKDVGDVSIIYEQRETEALDEHAKDSVSELIEDLKENEQKNASRKKFSLKNIWPEKWKIKTKAFDFGRIHISEGAMKMIVKILIVAGIILVIFLICFFIYKRKHRRGIHFHKHHKRTWESFNKSLADFKVDKK